MRRNFWQIWLLFQSKFIINILTGQKRDMTEQKLIWPVNMTGQYPKITLSPVHVFHLLHKTFKNHSSSLTIQFPTIFQLIILLFLHENNFL